MRRISAALAAISAIAFSQIASAADLPRKAPVAPAIVPYNWTGFYVGVNAGYTWGPWDASSNQIIFDPSATHDAKVNGALGGLQAGYNWQALARCHIFPLAPVISPLASINPMMPICLYAHVCDYLCYLGDHETVTASAVVPSAQCVDHYLVIPR